MTKLASSVMASSNVKWFLIFLLFGVISGFEIDYQDERSEELSNRASSILPKDISFEHVARDSPQHAKNQLDGKPDKSSNPRKSHGTKKSRKHQNFKNIKKIPKKGRKNAPKKLNSRKRFKTKKTNGGIKMKKPRPSQLENGNTFFTIIGKNGTDRDHLRLSMSAGPECGAFTLPSNAEGILYSENSQSAMECLTTIESPEGTTLQIVCPHFDLNSKGCKKEELFVSDPLGDFSTRGCRREGLSLVTSSNQMEIIHKRKKLRKKQCTGGFVCAVSVGRDPYVTGECGTYTLGPNEYTIIFSQNNGAKRKCTYNIEGSEGTELQFLCSVFDLAPGCKKEKLILKDNVSRKKSTYCSGDDPPYLTISKSAKLIHKRNKLRKKCSGGFLCFVGALYVGTTASPDDTPSVEASPSTRGPTLSPGQTLAPQPGRPFCGGCGNAQVTLPRIVGGQDASPAEYLWQALIKVGTSICGGSLIKKDWVVSAAHCFQPSGATSATVYLGAYSYSSIESDSSVQRFEVTNIINHPNYDAESQDNDIALLYLGQDAIFDSRVSPICLGREGDVTGGDVVITTGWGVLVSGSQTVTNILQEVALDVITTPECVSLYQNTFYISENMICTLTTGKDACQGDSGGPLVKQTSDGRWALVGVVSFGEGCASPDKPGVFTRTSNYINWITTTTSASTC